MVTVTIPGLAWFAEPIGADPHYVPEPDGMKSIQAGAKIRKRGRGTEVTLTGSVPDLLRLAVRFSSDGEVWLRQCVGPAARREARACLEAARRIRSECGVDPEY